jgi:hypothetical protein
MEPPADSRRERAAGRHDLRHRRGGPERQLLERHQVRANLHNLVSIAAITRPEQTGNPDYRRAVAPLLRLRRLVPEI